MAEDRMPFYEDPPGSGYYYSPDPRFPFPEELIGRTPRYLDELQGEQAEEERFRLGYVDRPDPADDGSESDWADDDWARPSPAPGPASRPAATPSPDPSPPPAALAAAGGKWDAARAAYEAGVGVSDICRRFDLAKSSVYDRRKREGWREPVDAIPAFDPQAAAPVLDDMRRMAVARLAHAIDTGLVSEVGTWLRACERMREWRFTGVMPEPRPAPAPAPEPTPAAAPPAPAPVQVDPPARVDPAPAVEAPIPSALPAPPATRAPIDAASVPPAASAQAAPCDLDADDVRESDAVREKAWDDVGEGADDDEPLMSVDEVMAQLDRAGAELQRARAQLDEAGGASVVFPDGHALADLPDEMDRLDELRTALQKKLRPHSGLDKPDTVRTDVSEPGFSPPP